MIKIKHNIKRTGRTLHGQILDCQFSGKEERGIASVKKGKYFIRSAALPGIWENELCIWGNLEYNNLKEISYTYPTEQAAQDMLDFINTFVEKDEAVKEETKEKRYMIVEVGGIKCPQRIEQDYERDIASFCKINALNPCLEEKCPHGKTLEQIQEEIKKLQEGQDDKSI